jgi:hypothetical protein
VATKRCTGFVNDVTPDGVQVKQCDRTLTTGVFSKPCENRWSHILRFKTGHCANGWHEGISPRTKSGNPAPSCTHYLTCPCKCHSDLDKLFQMSGMERILLEKSDYTVPERWWWMPSDEPLAPLSSNGAPDTPVMVESAAPGYVPPTMVREYGPTTTGRAARGELESWVKDKTDEWCIEKYNFPCTPAWISSQITQTHGIAPPSVGAIAAVFERWIKLDFAVIEKKPTRFISYTTVGIEVGLEGLKLRAKTAKRMKQSASARGVR